MLVRASDRSRAVFEYDAAGQRISGRTEDPPVAVQMAYDKAGRRIEESVTTEERSFSICHVYDALGNRLSTTLPDGTELATAYYGCGKALQIRLGGAPVTDFERDALHREISRTQGVLTSTRDYNVGGKLERQRAAAVQVTVGATSEIDRQFRYDLSGRLALSQERGRQLTYSYDAIDRLTRFNDERFAFDPAHNLAPPNQPGTVVPDNRVMASDDARYRYDAHGRVIEKRIGINEVILLSWDDNHRLIESTTTEGGVSRTTHYLYDAFGRRIAKRHRHGSSWFLWDTNRLLQEYRGVNEYTFMYEPGTLVPLAQAIAKRDGDALNTRSVYYFHCDQAGVPRELTDAQGHLAWTGEYHGWGRLKGQDQTDISVAAVPLRFQGGYCDEETGLHYNLIRYYDPDIARFISKDPVGLMGGVNEDRYVPNPVFWIDLFGLTGTYIFTDGTTSYVGKGPEKRFKTSKKARLKKTCGVATAATPRDFGDDDMGFMVEHLLMEHYSASASPGFANAPNLSSPGKKKYEAADADTKAIADAQAGEMIEDFEAQKATCP